MRRRKKARDRGAAAVEMALVLPILLLIVGGIVDLGRAFYTQSVLTSAAREGARLVAAGYSDSDAQTRMNSAAGGVSLPTPTITRCPAVPASTDAASVTLQMPTSGPGAFRWTMLDVIPSLVGGSIPAPQLKGVGSMTCLG